MNTLRFVNSKQKQTPSLTDTPYLVLASEPEDRLRTSRMGLRYHNRLVTKRTVFRRIRRELARQPGIWYDSAS